MNEISIQGGCLCGEIRFVAFSRPSSTVACHCKDCQRYTGGGPAYQCAFPRCDVRVDCGAPRRWVGRGDSGRGLTRLFCGTCGTPLFTELEKLPDWLIVNAGALDDPSLVKIKAHMFAASAPAWHYFDVDVPRFDRDLPPRAPRRSSEHAGGLAQGARRETPSENAKPPSDQ